MLAVVRCCQGVNKAHRESAFEVIVVCFISIRDIGL